jgi:hypothetical protein
MKGWESIPVRVRRDERLQRLHHRRDEALRALSLSGLAPQQLQQQLGPRRGRRPPVGDDDRRRPRGLERRR